MARLITYVDERKQRLVQLLTNDMESDPSQIIDIYRKRWEIELIVMQKGLTRSWSFSGVATMIRITRMYYVDFYSLFNHPEKDREPIVEAASGALPQLTFFD